MNIHVGDMIRPKPLKVEDRYYSEGPVNVVILHGVKIRLRDGDIEEVIPAPLPLEVGERVRIEGRDIVEIIAIHNQYAWCKWPDASQSLGTVLRTDLTRA